MNPLPMIVDAEPTPEEIRFLEERLYDFNVSATGIDDGQWLAIFVRDEQRRIVAGIAGNTWGGCCEIRQLWVDESLRGHGLGKRLLLAAETEARRRSCTQIVLSTHSFQAPKFYEKFGFQVVAAVDDYPRGHRQIYLRKRLQAA